MQIVRTAATKVYEVQEVRISGNDVHEVRAGEHVEHPNCEALLANCIEGAARQLLLAVSVHCEAVGTRGLQAKLELCGSIAGDLCTPFVQIQVVEITEQSVGPVAFSGFFKLSFDSRIMQPFCGMCTINSQYVYQCSRACPVCLGALM